VNFSQEEITELAACIWFEGRNGGTTSMHAIAHCAKNRIGAEGFPKTLIGVIYQRNAFSWTRPDNPEHTLDPVASTGLDQTMYQEALRLAALVLNTDDPDVTQGSHYYENPKSASSGWFSRIIAGPDLMGTEDHPFTIEIGGQRYYK
jgi:spore germination cell wall hydrolase CwlJ-like protein